MLKTKYSNRDERCLLISGLNTADEGSSKLEYRSENTTETKTQRDDRVKNTEQTIQGILKNIKWYKKCYWNQELWKIKFEYIQ